MKEITLSHYEVASAVLVGIKRRFESVKRGNVDRNGMEFKNDAEQWGANVSGALGELVFSKFLGIHWNPTINAPKGEPDILPDWQIKCLSKHWYDLTVRPDAVDDHKYVLITGVAPEYRVVGWIYAKDAKRKEWLEDKGGRGAPAYWVPQANLNKFSESVN